MVHGLLHISVTVRIKTFNNSVPQSVRDTKSVHICTKNLLYCLCPCFYILSPPSLLFLLHLFSLLFVTNKSYLIRIQLVVSLPLQCSGDAELLQVLRPGDMAVYAVLAAAVQGPGLHPHHLFLLCHLLFLTCIQPLLQFPTNLLLLLPGLQLPSLHLQRARRDRHTAQVALEGQLKILKTTPGGFACFIPSVYVSHSC